MSTNNNHPENEFSVCQFFPDGTHEYVRQWVNAEEALKAFKHYTTCVTASYGMTVRVIVTDGGDCINLEWKYGKGLTYPTLEDLSEAKRPAQE